MSDSVSRAVSVKGENGLHLVPCSQVAQCAGEFECEIRIVKGDRRVDARIIFDLMSLNAGEGSRLELTASGSDAAQAVENLVNLFEPGFHGHVNRAD